MVSFVVVSLPSDLHASTYFFLAETAEACWASWRKVPPYKLYCLVDSIDSNFFLSLLPWFSISKQFSSYTMWRLALYRVQTCLVHFYPSILTIFSHWARIVPKFQSLCLLPCRAKKFNRHFIGRWCAKRR